MAASESVELWHDRLAHTAASTIESLASNDPVYGLFIKSKADEIRCESCRAGKITRGPFNGSNSSAEKVGDVTHPDLAGPMTATLGGKRYMASFLEEKTLSANMELLQKKSDTKGAFIE